MSRDTFWHDQCKEAEAKNAELTKLLAEAKRKPVPEGMVLVPKDRITFGDCYRFGLNPNDIAVAPQLETDRGSNE